MVGSASDEAAIEHVLQLYEKRKDEFAEIELWGTAAASSTSIQRLRGSRRSPRSDFSGTAGSTTKGLCSRLTNFGSR
jgi:hypothetical protein